MIWAYYGQWLKEQIEFEENPLQRASKKRIYHYILSTIGLTASLTGISLLLALIIHIITGHLSSDGFRHPLSGALATLIVGLPLWIMNWVPMQAEALADGEIGNHARRSVIRKSYLYLALFAGVIGGMISAVILVFTLINSALGGDTSNFTDTVLNSLQVLILFIVLLLYHLSSLQRDNAARADVLEAKQENFGLLLFNNKGGKFADSIKTALAKLAPKVPVTIVNPNDTISKELKVNAVVLPGSLTVNTPGNISAWISSFNGSKFIVPDEGAGVYWMNDPEQTAEAIRGLAEGQEVRPQSGKKTTSVWTYVAYVFAALFALQLLLFLVVFGISIVTGF